MKRHAEQARALRLFVADGSEPGGNTKIQRYLGQFRLDVDRPTATAEAPDTDGNLRSVIVFRLVPVGPVLRRSEDDSAVGDVSTEPRLDRVDHGDLIMTAGSAEAVPVEVVAARGYDVAGSASTAAVKREAELVMRYQAHLEQQGHTCVRYRIRPPGELRDLYTDIFDETKNILYEAKGVATREAVRMAVGQLLDYKRHLPNSPALSILLPAEPSYDLTDFMRRNGIRCVYPEPGGSFRGV